MIDADPDPSALRRVAESLARGGARVIMRTARSGELRIDTKVSRSDLVTSADRASEEYIVTRLRRRRPRDGVVGEEGNRVSSSSGVTWIIDPLDGTANFTRSLPPHGVSVAAWHDYGGADTPLAAAVFDLAHGEMFSAAAGSGATFQGEPIASPPGPDLATAIVGTGFAHDPVVRRAEADIVAHLLPEIGDLRRSGAGAFDLCWVAIGRIDAFYQPGLHVWDYAAARLVLLESGADLTLLPGVAGSSPTVLGSAPGLTASIIELLHSSGVPRR